MVLNLTQLFTHCSFLSHQGSHCLSTLAWHAQQLCFFSHHIYYVLIKFDPSHSCYAENLWHHLKKMGLFENDESHPALGNIKQALETLVQQRLEA
jgi:hypothetical protein